MWKSLLLSFVLFGPAQAHDTWFARQPDGSATLGTGAMFPKQETGIDPQFLLIHACNASNCWAQTTPFDLELAPDKIALYLDEVRPDAALLDAWRALQARGLPWRERYAKHARIVQDAAAAATPSGMAMDVLLLGGTAPRRGQALTFQVLRDGRPLPQFAVELRNDRSRFGIWRRTDDAGRLSFTPPFAAQWLLRGIDLRLSETVPDTFDSRFVTLAFDVKN